MSDHDLQDNTNKKQAAPEPAKKETAKVTNVVFDEIPTLKDSPVETKQPAEKREEERPQIDFFGVNNQEDSADKNKDIMFDDLENDFEKDKNSANPFG
jgi:hypothetical protein